MSLERDRVRGGRELTDAMSHRMWKENAAEIPIPFNPDSNRAKIHAWLLYSSFAKPRKAAEHFRSIARVTLKNDLSAAEASEEDGEPEQKASLLDYRIEAAVDAQGEQAHEKSFRNASRLRARALVLAEEWGVKPARIFKDDELYNLLFSDTFTPEEYAVGSYLEFKAYAGRFPGELLKQAEAYRQRKALIEGVEVDRNKRLALGSNSQESMREVEPLVLQQIGQDIRRFWGSKGIDAIPAGLRAEIRALEAKQSV